MPGLPEREGVRLGAGLGEGQLQRALADGVVLAHELVHAGVPELPVAVLVDVDAVREPWSLAIRQIGGVPAEVTG